ncbi:MAG: ABC transporter permease [Thermoanaerobaculia bacterium]
MLAYQVKIALKSLRRNPVLSVLMVAGIALGIAVSTAFITTHYLMSGDPIPHKSDSLYYVELDSWHPDTPWDDDHPEYPPNQITYTDMRGIMESDIPTYQGGAFKGSLTVQPESETEKPYREIVRMCFSGFFPMMDVPFEYGGGWGKSADEGPEPVVVIDAETNRKLFGGENSVGRTLRIENQNFTVVGVVAEWRPSVKFYDVHNGGYDEPEAIYMPFNFNVPMEIYSSGNNSNWKYYEGDEYQDWLLSENIWIQMWVQLDSREQRDEYLSFLNAYTSEQKKLGRFQRPTNNLVLPVMEYLEQEEVVPEEATALLIISILFLIVCSVNLIGILLGKFLARAPEIGVRRALGASRRSVFIQHLVECELLGLIGGVVGIGLSIVALDLINRLFENQFSFHLDLNMVLAALVLSLAAGFVAGIYPAWRICRVPPANYLKLQ